MRSIFPMLKRMAAALAALTVLAAPAGAAQVTDVRMGAEADGLRLVIEADQPLDYRLFTLADQGLRMVLDLPRVDWAIPGEPAAGGQRRAAGEGLISQYRFAQNTADTSRLVLDLASPARVANQFTLAPGAGSASYRMVLDLSPVSFQEFAAASGVSVEPPPAAFAAAPVPEVQVPEAQGDATVPESRITSAPPPAQLAEKPVIVIDAGHGGRDPGALGATGKREKDANLAAALALGEILRATGRYEVVLTRSTDIFLELDQRVSIARGKEADLFISLHSDSTANGAAQGASVYTLDTTGAARARKKVLSNNWVMDVTLTGRPQEVSQILVDLSQRDTKNQSSAFAEMMMDQLEGRGVNLLRNTHREGNLYVLLAPDVPAVLLEMGFMSNRADEANLMSATYRKKMMSAVADSIDEYFGARQRRFAGN